MSAVCWQCIEDEYLRDIIRKRGVPNRCDLCKARRKVLTADALAEAIDPIIRQHFRPGEYVKRFGGDDQEWWEQEGDSLNHHLQTVIGQYLGFEEEIIAALEENDPARPQDGDVPFYDSSQDYVSTPIRPYAYYIEWNFALNDLKHYRRFFNSSASSLFQRVFNDVETRAVWNSEARTSEPVIWTMPEGSLLYRARICDSQPLVKNAYRDPMKHVGPPPPESARAGRMNADGVVVFYGALDSETCLAETRPAIGNDTAVIQLKTNSGLRLLDFWATRAIV